MNQSTSTKRVRSLPSFPLILLGTLHSTLAGYRLVPSDPTDRKTQQTSSDLPCSLIPSFTTRCHSCGPILSVAAVDGQKGSRGWIVSSGQDERLCIFRRRPSISSQSSSVFTVGSLSSASALNILRFTNGMKGSPCLVAGAEDGSVVMYSTRTWDCQAVIPSDGGGIQAMALHPSTSLAALCLRTKSKGLDVLDLVQGKWLMTNSRNLTKGTESEGKEKLDGADNGENSSESKASESLHRPLILRDISMSSDGSFVCVAGPIDLFLLDGSSSPDAPPLQHVQLTSESTEIQCVTWLLPDGPFIVGEEGGSLRLFGPNGLRDITSFHTASPVKSRVKCLQSLWPNRLVSVYGSGLIRVWQLDGERLWLEAERETGSHPTCLAVVED